MTVIPRRSAGTTSAAPAAPPPLSDALTGTPWTLSTGYPVALLPVRLETRFAGATLRIRVYPDQIHIDGHEPRMTDDEVAAGRAYWLGPPADGDPAPPAPLASTGPAGPPDGPLRTPPGAEAWTELVRRFGATRAGWIARVMEPDPATGELPDPLRRPAPWCEPARVRLLPTRWYAVGRTTGNTLFTGVSGPVARDLAAGPTPVPTGGPATGTPIGAGAAESPPVDEGMRWMVDYPAAVAAGMAFAVDVPTDGAGRPQPVDRLLVFGVDADTAPDISAARLNRLLEAHAATDGLAFLPPGTPTNNTETVTVTERPPVAPVTGTDVVPGGTGPQVENAAALAGRALAVPLSAAPLSGVPAGSTPTVGAPPPPAVEDLATVRRRAVRPDAPTALARAASADRDERRLARLVRRALWPAGPGSMLRHLLPVATPAEQRKLRAHFVEHLHPEGPLPTLRIGAQPYGLLPVAALRGWQPASPAEARAVTVLRNLWQQVWLAAPAPRIRPGLADPEQTMVEILATDARVLEVRARSMLGNEYVSWLWRFARLDLGPGWRQQVVEPGRALLAALGLGGPVDPRLSLAVFAKNAFALGTPLVAAPGQDRADRIRAYLDALAAVGLRGDQIPAAPASAGPVPLFHRLLRAALIAEHSAAADLLAEAAGLPAAAEIPEPELVDIRPGEVTPTLRRRLAVTVPGTGGRSVGEYLAAAAGDDDTRHRLATADLRELRDALADLATGLAPTGDDPAALDPDDLDRYVAGTLGLTAHRLDAWITSLASTRLDRLAATRPAGTPDGVHVGAYGWLTDLHPAPPPTLVDRPAHVPDTAAPPQLVAAPADAGHVHAPSPAQAVTAAVLRSAWRSHGGGDDNPVAVDLSSRRVRLAGQILAGMRDGQALGELLGYRFERGLHDHPGGPLDQYIPLFRRLAPVRAHRVDPNGDGPPDIVGTVASTAVADGLELHRLHRAGALATELAKLPGGARIAVGEVLAELADHADAVADALLAEGVHQLAVGDMDRAAAAVDVASGAAGSPPELHFTRTPAGGVSVTHRVALLFNLDARFADRRSDWPAGRSEQPRVIGAAADALTAALLPPANRVCWRARWHAPDGGVTDHVEGSLDRLQVAAVDHLAAPPHPGAPAGTDLDRRIEMVAWSSLAPPQVTPEWRLELDYDRAPGWPASRVSLAEFLAAVAALRDLFGRGRQLLAADLGTDSDAPVQVDDATRSQATELWQLALDTATGLRAAGSPGDPGWNETTVRTLLRTAAGFGIVGVLPPLPGTGAAATAAEAARSAGDELARRVAAHCRLVAEARGRTPCPVGGCVCDPETDFDDPTAPPADRRELHVARIRALLGADMPVLSASRAPDPVALTTALAASDALQGGSPHPVRRWLARYGRVRPAVGRLQEVLTYADALGAGGTVRVPTRVRVAQLPYQAGDRWAGEAAPPPGSQPTSLVLVSLGDLDLTRPVHGLLVDEWTEVVPAATTRTGLTFEYDAPAAAAGQAVLLAVSADGAATWQPAGLAQAVEETLDLAVARVTDLDSLGAGGQYLPAFYLPTNVAEAATTTDFVPDAAPVAPGEQEGR
ncbi:hypothetical protein [Micromonospora rubida]|uniref:hypothetical protein n=1 Tax=Micromonospora rubida TaxID=2697657 RepID=UPI001378394E|nr:hypothetical protein [Micromonospora rubida]NBE80004.1 hypothetical protein [Micromonospora rubida]